MDVGFFILANMVQRIIWGSVFGVVLIGTLLFGKVLGFTILITAIAFLCLTEFVTLMGIIVPEFKVHQSFYASYGVVSLSAMVLLWGLTAAGLVFEKFFWGSVVFIYSAFFYELLFNKKERSFIHIALFALAALYIVLPLLFVFNIAISHHVYSPHKILGIFILIWTCDTMQYFSGKLLGRTKLYEAVSPNKTMEGAFGGVVFTLVAGYILAQVWPDFTLQQWLVIAGITAVMGIAGDLVESVLKRQAAVKDSGQFLPGHGGALDRFDSFIFVIPFIALYLLVFC